MISIALPNEKPASIDDDTYAGRCLRETLSEFTMSDGAARSDNVQDRLDYVFRNLEKMMHTTARPTGAGWRRCLTSRSVVLA